MANDGLAIYKDYLKQITNEIIGQPVTERTENIKQPKINFYPNQAIQPTIPKDRIINLFQKEQNKVLKQMEKGL